jgi:hypothetical protein
MDAEQAIRLITEIELRLAFAGVGEGDGLPAPWPPSGVTDAVQATP